MISLDHRAYNVPGIIVSVSDQGGAIKHYTCGLANVMTQQAMDYHLLLRCDLITRTFMAAILLRLADAQALNIDAPLGQLARQHQQDDGLFALMVSQYPFLKPVTVRELLNNTSGLPAFDKSAAYNAIFTRKPLKKWQVENYLDAISGSDAAYQHGYRVGHRGDYADSATNFVVAGLVASAVSGVNTSESMKDLFRLFALENTHYLPYGVLSRDLAGKMIRCYLPVSHPYASAFERQEVIYYNDNKELQVYDVTAAYAVNGMGNAAMVSSSSDLIRWWHALLADETVVNYDRNGFKKTAKLRAGNDYFFGVHRSVTPDKGEILWSAGNNLGSSVFLAYSVDKKITFLVTINVSREHFALSSEGLLADIMQQLL